MYDFFPKNRKRHQMLNLEHRSLPPPRRPMGLRGADCPSPSQQDSWPTGLSLYFYIFNIQRTEKYSIAMRYLPARTLSLILYLMSHSQSGSTNLSPLSFTSPSSSNTNQQHQQCQQQYQQTANEGMVEFWKPTCLSFCPLFFLFWCGLLRCDRCE